VVVLKLVVSLATNYLQLQQIHTMDEEATFLSAIAHGETSSWPVDLNVPRALNENNDNQYLLDANGNEYDPYSLAWRYLGMYIDCDVDQHQRDDNANGDDVFRRQKQRRRHMASGDGNDDDDCSRKLLWAAYHDPGYKEGQIGEYQFYDWRNNEWDTSTCQTKRCAKMDCHAKPTHFQLIGVFKETDGLGDWAEQLIKHEGYCVWNDVEDDEGDGAGQGSSHSADNKNSNFEFMYNRQEKWTQGCYAMYLTDSYGNKLYRAIRPLPGGNITDGLYLDDDCTQKASMSFMAYIVSFYTKYYYDKDMGEEVALQWQQNVERWNDLMQDFKICQPCRSYSKTPNYNTNEEHRKFRFLGEDNGEYNGEGDDEQWGYNCYDNAGYQNCDQCYKFEVKTDLEPASVEDLQRASAQGTILAIKVDGQTYGKGGIHWHDDVDPKTVVLVVVLLAIVGMIASSIALLKWKNINAKASIVKISERVRSRRFDKSLREGFFEDDDNNHDIDNNTENRLQAELDQSREVIEHQKQEMVKMQLEMDQELSIRNMEWESSRNWDQSIDESTDEEDESIDDKFNDEPTDDEARDTDNDSGAEGGSIGAEGGSIGTDSISRSGGVDTTSCENLIE
jgi:hypothetical protein